MNYKEWSEAVPAGIKGDALWRMEVYRLALFAVDLAWPDVSALFQDKRMFGVADQLYRSVGSIAANVAEGYSRQSGRDQARFYEYALGSAREARGWYYQGRHILKKEVVAHRIQLLVQIIRLLLTIIPSERGSKMKDETPPYDVVSPDLLDAPPLP